ncbi:hypothetical protein PM082_003622 [Marasmius tenuissimus]|nr:hypothetical protein PM082_003622 [Marasmius tenuissimus]
MDKGNLGGANELVDEPYFESQREFIRYLELQDTQSCPAPSNQLPNLPFNKEIIQSLQDRLADGLQGPFLLQELIEQAEARLNIKGNWSLMKGERLRDESVLRVFQQLLGEVAGGPQNRTPIRQAYLSVASYLIRTANEIIHIAGHSSNFNHILAIANDNRLLMETVPALVEIEQNYDWH